MNGKQLIDILKALYGDFDYTDSKTALTLYIGEGVEIKVFNNGTNMFRVLKGTDYIVGDFEDEKDLARKIVMIIGGGS